MKKGSRTTRPLLYLVLYKMLGAMICSLHNEGFILKLVADARQAILDGCFDEFRTDFVGDYYKK